MRNRRIFAIVIELTTVNNHNHFTAVSICKIENGKIFVNGGGGLLYEKLTCLGLLGHILFGLEISCSSAESQQSAYYWTTDTNDENKSLSKELDFDFDKDVQLNQALKVGFSNFCISKI